MAEPEDVLAKPNPELCPAHLAIRQWTFKMEADVTEWSSAALPPLAAALRYNTAMLGVRAKDAPQVTSPAPRAPPPT